MNFVTTNIRIPEEDYLRLKNEAAKRRKSLSQIIRERISNKKIKKLSAEALISRLRKHASENVRYLKNVSGVKLIREMRDNAKW